MWSSPFYLYIPNQRDGLRGIIKSSRFVGEMISEQIHTKVPAPLQQSTSAMLGLTLYRFQVGSNNLCWKYCGDTNTFTLWLVFTHPEQEYCKKSKVLSLSMNLRVSFLPADTAPPHTCVVHLRPCLYVINKFKAGTFKLVRISGPRLSSYMHHSRCQDPPFALLVGYFDSIRYLHYGEYARLHTRTIWLAILGAHRPSPSL